MIESLVYISGSGRSGSTLLERIFHSAPGVAALGEFHCLWRLPPDQLTCACGARFDADPVWAEILAHAGIDRAGIAELLRLEEIVARSGYIARHGFSLDRLRAQPEVQRFLALQFRIFDAIAAHFGAPVIVDSSKAGPRAWIMACDPRTRIVHIYREPTDVIASWRSTKFDKGLGTAMQRLSVRHAAMDWWKVEHLARRLSRVSDVVFLDYRRLCAAPEAEIDRVLGRLGLADRVQATWAEAAVLQPRGDYHSLNGNPDRFENSPIPIRPRGVDWSRYATGDRLAIQAAGTLLRSLYAAPRKP